jgi:exodeoxyribonuclease VII small subunit
MSEPKNDLNKLLAKLDELLVWFDKSDIDLDEALKKFDEGVKLTEGIKAQLTEAENKIAVLKKRFGSE